MAYSLLQDYDKAIVEFKAALRIASRFNVARNNLGNTYYKKKDFLKAEKIFQESLEIFSEDIEAYKNLVNVYAALGRKKESQERLEKVINILEKEKMFDQAEDLRRILDSEAFNKEDY